MTALSPRRAYDLWAPTYRGDNAVCVLEDQLVSALTPSPHGKRLLDVGCGAGLRLRNSGAAFAVGVDASPEMLAASGLANIAAADIRALPFAPAMFDLIWCRLMLGYLSDLAPGYAELARVCRNGGLTIVSDFHSEASRAGHRQTFRDGEGTLHEITCDVHDIVAHVDAAAAAGLSLLFSHDGTVGPAVRPLYEEKKRLEMYDRDLGLAIVQILVFEKDQSRVSARSLG